MRKTWIAVVSLAVIVFIIRLTAAFNAEFSVDESYFHLRQAEHIQETGFPLKEDPLSYGGSEHLFSPAFQYLIAGLGLITGIPIAAKIITNLLASSLIVVVFAFALQTTRSKQAAFIGALAAAFIPSLWNNLASATPHLLGIFLGFFMLLAFLKLDDPFWRNAFLFSMVVGAIARPGFLLFIAGLILYLALASMAGVKRPKGESELIFFATLFSLWITFVVYKRLFIAHGLNVLWQNTPTSVISQYFAEITVLDAVVAVGILPFIAGTYVMYRHLFVEQNRTVYLVMGLALATGTLVWLRLIRPELGLEVLGISLVLLFSFALAEFFKYVEKTKLKKARRWVTTGAVLLVTIAGIPAWFEGKDALQNTLSVEEKHALEWLRTTSDNAIVLATLEEGHAIQAIARRGTVADTRFPLKTDAEIRVHEIGRAFASPFDNVVVEVMEKYGATHVLWTKRTQTLSGRETPPFAANPCFPKVFFEESVAIYELTCSRDE